jgi:hypothetical protein
MQLTTIEQLKEVKPLDTLFLINAFSNTSQGDVNISAFNVLEVKSDRFNGRGIVGSESDLIGSGSDSKFFGDLLNQGHYVYTDALEASEKLKEVRDGLHEVEVKKHHDQLEAWFY